MRSRVPRQLGYLLTAMLACGGTARAAETSPQQAPAQEKVAIDSTSDVTSSGGFSVDLNGTFAPFSGLSESGFRFRLTGASSWSRYIVSEEPRTYGTSRTSGGDLLVGYGWVAERISLIALVGGIVAHTEDTGAPAKTLGGAKAVVSFYAVPWDRTMAYGSYRYSTVNNAYQLQTKVGVQVFGGLYIGPELVFAGSDVYAQRRLGMHVSGLKLGPLQVGLSGGWSRNLKTDQDGGYVGLSLYTAF